MQMIPFELSLDEFNEVEGALLYQATRLEDYIKEYKPLADVRQSIEERIERIAVLYDKLKLIQINHYKKS